MKLLKHFFICAVAIIALCGVVVLSLTFSGYLARFGINSIITNNVSAKVIASATDTQLDPSAKHLTIDMGAAFTPDNNYSLDVKSDIPFPVQTDVYFYNGETRNGMIGIIPAGSTSASFSGKSPKIVCNKIRLATTEKAQGITVTLVVKKDVDAIHDLYDEISSLNDGRLPDYWKQHIDNKVEEIWARKVQLSPHSVEFFFVTDTHWKTNARNSSALLSYLTKKCHIPFVLFGGDVIETYARSKTQAYHELKNFYDAFRSLKMVTAIGNHDTNTTSNSNSATFLTKAELYGLMQKESEDFSATHRNCCPATWITPLKKFALSMFISLSILLMQT